MKIWCASILLLVTNFIFAQGKYEANWCFGIGAGINFNNTAVPVNFNTLCNEDVAAACISDSLGNLLFYIAPDSFFLYGAYFTPDAIYNNNNQIITNGDSLNVGSELTGTIILSFPQTNDYYLFYMYSRIVDWSGLNYAKVIKDSTGYEVVTKNIELSNIPLEWGIAAVKHANGNDWWLVAHEYNSDSGSNLFLTFLVTKDSIFGPFIQNIGNLNSSFGVFGTQLKFSKDGNWLASALDDQNEIDLFNFDRCTGQLKNFILLDSVDSLGDDEIGDCEFSDDGTKLYASEGFGDVSSKSALYQFDLTNTDINSSKIKLYATDSAQTTFGHLKRAPDNKIYLAVEFSGREPYRDTTYNQFNQYLWVINDPDSTGTACNFQPYGYLLGDSARVYWALPNMPNYNLGAISTYRGIATDTTICNLDSVTIGSPFVSGVTYAWQPATGITDTTLAQQTVKPDTSTWYYVTLTDTTINYSCQSVTDSFFVQVVHCCDSALLSQCTLSKDTFICTDEDTPTKGALLIVDTVPGVSFAWQAVAGISIHSTQQIVNPSQSTWYYVTFFSDSDSSLACNKRLDSVYVKVGTCMGIEEISTAMQHLNIYPNPAQNFALVEWQPVEGQLQLSVTDLLGRVVSNFKVDGMAGKTQLDISSLANGLYVVRVTSTPAPLQLERGVYLTGKLAITR